MRLGYRTRRWLGVSTAINLACLIGALLLAYTYALHRTAFMSGWVLLAVVLFLAAYNGRKKLTYPPLGKSSTWLQLHIYGGLLCVVIYLYHTAGRWPSGIFETALALLFYGVAVSGVLGLAITRLVPKRLTLAGDEVIYERIPAFRQELREQVDQLVLETVNNSGGTTLAEFHAQRLAPFFAGPRHRGAHLGQSSGPLRRLLDQLADLNRFFNDAEKQAAEKLTELIQLKNRLDYHAAMQGLLKAWLFVHIPLTFAMLLCVAVHVVLVHAFREVGG